MKKIMIVAVMMLVAVFFTQANAEPCPNCPNRAGQDMMQDGCQQKHMMKHKTMMQEQMGMIKDTMKIQQKMIAGVSMAEKDEMTKELSRMMDRMDAMMSETNKASGCGCGKGCDKPCDGCKKKETEGEAPAGK